MFNVLSEIKNFSSTKLKKVQTRVVTSDGRELIEHRDRYGGIISKETGKIGPNFVTDTKPDLQIAEILPGLCLVEDKEAVAMFTHTSCIAPPIKPYVTLDPPMKCYVILDWKGQEISLIGHSQLSGVGQILDQCSQDPATDVALLKKNNITHILNVASGVDNALGDQFVCKKIEILDLPETNIRAAFDSCFAFIHNARNQRGKVLVHCNAGVSRSATVLLAYLMKHEGMHFDQAMDTVKAKRDIKPNEGFLRQLKAFDEELAIARSAAIKPTPPQQCISVASISVAAMPVRGGPGPPPQGRPGPPPSKKAPPPPPDEEEEEETEEETDEEESDEEEFQRK